jgi:hypothetical protein
MLVGLREIGVAVSERKVRRMSIVAKACAIHTAKSEADVRPCWPAFHELRPHLQSGDEFVKGWRTGDSIYYDGDCMHGFATPGRVPCVYYLAMDISGEMDGTTHRLAPSARPTEERGEGAAVPGPARNRAVMTGQEGAAHE